MSKAIIAATKSLCSMAFENYKTSKGKMHEASEDFMNVLNEERKKGVVDIKGFYEFTTELEAKVQEEVEQLEIARDGETVRADAAALSAGRHAADSHAFLGLAGLHFNKIETLLAAAAVDATTIAGLNNTVQGLTAAATIANNTITDQANTLQHRANAITVHVATIAANAATRAVDRATIAHQAATRALSLRVTYRNRIGRKKTKRHNIAVQHCLSSFYRNMSNQAIAGTATVATSVIAARAGHRALRLRIANVNHFEGQAMLASYMRQLGHTWGQHWVQTDIDTIEG